jgi:hypothetical protein
MKRVILISTIFLSGCVTQTTTISNCNVMSESISKSKQPEKIVRSQTKVNGSWAFTFDPLILPVSIKFNPSTGFSVVHSGQKGIITPLGVVGIQYSLSSQSNKTINGYTVSDGDFIVGLINKTLGSKEVFKIEGYNKLKVITNGRTVINTEAGYVEIDVTDATIEELKFEDNSKFSIVNTTNKTQKYFLGIKAANGKQSSTWYECEIEPQSYKIYPAKSYTDVLTKMFDNEYEFKLENSDASNNKTTSVVRGISYGEVCNIKFDNDGKSLTLEKMVD